MPRGSRGGRPDMKHLSIAVLIAFLIASPVRADVIVTTAGGRIEGKIIEEKENEIRIKPEKGHVITLSRDEIDSITKEKPEDAFARRSKAVKGDDVKGLMELAQWAKDNRLPKQSEETYERVLKLEPNHGDARAALGFERVNGKWYKG